MTMATDSPKTIKLGEQEFADLLGARIDAAFSKHLPTATLKQDPEPTTAPKWVSELSELMQNKADGIDAGEVLLRQEDGSMVLRPRKDLDREANYAVMGQVSIADAASQLDGALGVGIPWGSILLGAIPGAVVGEVIDGLLPPRNAKGELNFANLGVKGVIAAGAASFGPDLIGKTPAMLFVGALGVQMLSDILPLDRWVRNIIDFILRRDKDNTATQNQILRQRLEAAQAPANQAQLKQGIQPIEFPVSNPVAMALQAG